MVNLKLHGMDVATLHSIECEARRREVSVNQLIIETLQQKFTRSFQNSDTIETLAGTWSEKESAEFEAAIAPFSGIDRVLWAARPNSEITFGPK